MISLINLWSNTGSCSNIGLDPALANHWGEGGESDTPKHFRIHGQERRCDAQWQKPQDNAILGAQDRVTHSSFES